MRVIQIDFNSGCASWLSEVAAWDVLLFEMFDELCIIKLVKTNRRIIRDFVVLIALRFRLKSSMVVQIFTHICSLRVINTRTRYFRFEVNIDR